MIDALAYERQFLDHIAPLWRELPLDVRGDFIVDPSLVERARGLGIDPLPRPRPDFRRGMPIPVSGATDRPALVASYGDTKEARRYGYGPIAYLEHGIGQSYGRTGHRAHPSYSGGADRDDTGLFLVPGEDPAARWRAAYPRARVEVVGSPRLDYLPRREGPPGRVVAVSFHWPAHVSISGYAGTAFADHARSLRAIADAYPVLGHCHPKGDWPRVMRDAYTKLGIPFVDDFEEVCRLADLYVCDNSSTLYEFAATGRPVVVLNAQTWHRNGPEYGLRFWSASHVGINAAPGELTPELIGRALARDEADELAREDALSKVYGFRSHGAERAAAVVVDWLADVLEVAA